jgi:hypothetical protein
MFFASVATCLRIFIVTFDKIGVIQRSIPCLIEHYTAFKTSYKLLQSVNSCLKNNAKKKFSVVLTMLQKQFLGIIF